MTLYTLVNEKGTVCGETTLNPLDRSLVLDVICTADIGGREVPVTSDNIEEAQELADLLNKNIEEAHFSPRLVSSRCEEKYRINLSYGRIINFSEAIEKMFASKPLSHKIYPYALGATIGFISVVGLDYSGVFDKIIGLLK